MILNDMVAIIDYGTGNIFSLCNAVKRAGFDYTVTSNTNEIKASSHVILPGVGEASEVMKEIARRDLGETIKTLKVPVLGICIGMQVMCSFSEEGGTECLSIFPERVLKLGGEGVKIPHMGWNRVNRVNKANGVGGVLFDGIEQGEWFYFVHSFAPEKGISVQTTTEYGVEFSSTLIKDNFYGTQFHPEKSGVAGERFLMNFLNTGKNY